ncbi:hypothetical protein VNO78_16349 [Psophocarpus tetragonolobus]|uniref:Uncharacterized protein n=1 Tax=Psophocarpus tetragonolobus TaxID=3891 RepID=A0AAN9SHR3_PSOTE
MASHPNFVYWNRNPTSFTVEAICDSADFCSCFWEVRHLSNCVDLSLDSHRRSQYRCPRVFGVFTGGGKHLR